MAPAGPGRLAAMALKTNTPTGITSRVTTSNCTSLAWSFLPRYSGVRPIIRPARNTAINTLSNMPYMPAPTPPKITSPTIMLTSATIPLRGLRLSCMPLTEPLDAAVVVTDHSTVPVVPKRVSLPSNGAVCSTAGLFRVGLGWYSDHSDVAPPIKNNASMHARIARL
ncbi:hypothetical protein PFLmoz3_03594 [Pseudomonas fluorescens]|uniref:Uncharacterized protein n=1 Tax=Pseudomonas fluorescens TaxID=294 RepID=A0A109LFF1_PSEFL|nr:hypothetical protein PFLmoz3_03594 [Pseudomonas fluorescens]